MPSNDREPTGPLTGQGGYEIKPSLLKEDHAIIVRKGDDSQIVIQREYTVLTVWAGIANPPADGDEHLIQLPIGLSADEGEREREIDDFFARLFPANIDLVVLHNRGGHDDEVIFTQARD